MKKSALILGGGGIGTEIAKRILENDPDKKVVIASRNPQEAWENNPRVTTISLDLSKDSLECLGNLDIDTLIFTAGMGRLNYFETMSQKEIEKTFSVNTLGAIKAIRMFYDRINSSEPFYTAVITSIAGMIASPLYSVYSASKAALVKFIEAVNAELGYKNRSNRILNVAPGYVGGTNFHGGERTQEEQAYLENLSRQILDNMYHNQELFIPKYDEVYGDVIKRYQADPAGFARESIAYKLENGRSLEGSSLKTGYLTGTFDLFHVGHLNLLRNAKRYCDRLVVGVHPDAKHKNKEVFIPLEDRMEILRSVCYVDDVMVCGNEDTDAYETVKYDYLFVGSDYQGTERFRKYEEFFADKGVKIIYLPYTTKTSSTQLRQAITDAAKK